LKDKRILYGCVAGLVLLAVAWLPLAASWSSGRDREAGLAGAPAGVARERSEPRSSFESPTIEHAVILKLVRQYLPTADASWRQAIADAVYIESLAAGVDPLMIAAIIARESSFRSRAVSRAGAVGLMQVQPTVALDVVGRMGLEWRGLDTLHHPYLNVRLGVLYYQELVERFGGDLVTALAAYNRGPSCVSRELREGTFDDRRYADSVLSLYQRLDARRILDTRS
jgi:soluble lytic murein transglycosylase-like protein